MVLLLNIKTILNDVSFPAMAHSTLEPEMENFYISQCFISKTQHCYTVRSIIYFYNTYFCRSIPPSAGIQHENTIGKAGYERGFSFTNSLTKYIKYLLFPA